MSRRVRSCQHVAFLVLCIKCRIAVHAAEAIFGAVLKAGDFNALLVCHCEHLLNHKAVRIAHLIAEEYIPVNSLRDFRLYGLSAYNHREQQRDNNGRAFHFRPRLSSVRPTVSFGRLRYVFWLLLKDDDRVCRYVS